MFLIGRETERDQVTAALAASGVVALVGPAGIGKSALAAAFCLDRPVLWIDARGSLGVEGLAAATTGRRDLAELVVIDGVAAHEPQARLTAVVHSFAVPVLLTSRRRLNADLTHVELGPLDPSAGAALLRQRITHPGRSATLHTTELERLSAALGGVPAALCRAAAQLELLDVQDLVKPRQAPRKPPDGVRQSVVHALARLPGAVTTRLLSSLAGADATSAVAELVFEGVAEAFPSGAATVRLRPMGDPVDDGGDAAHAHLLGALETLLPAWEALASAAQPGATRAQATRLQEDAPALRALCGSPNADVALRAACVIGGVHQLVGTESRSLALDQALPRGQDPLVAARWANVVAKACIRANDGPTGVAALDRRPAPAGTLEAVDQASLRARLLEVAGERARGAEWRAIAMERCVGTPLEGDVRYRDAVSRYWSGDFAGAVEGLERALTCSDPAVHRLRVVKATILRTLLRRELGADSGELLAELLPIDPLWRNTVCAEGPTVLVLTGALHADLAQWTQADATLAEATELLLRLGRRNEAANQALQRASFEYVSGRVPDLALAQLLGLSSPEEVQRRLAPFAHAEVLGWRAVRAAALGQPARARVDLQGATSALEHVGRPLRGAELTANVLAALIGADAHDAQTVDALLPRVTGTPQLVTLHGLLAHALGRGDPPTPPTAPRLEHHVLLALLSRRHTLQVAADGGWFRAPGQPAVSLGRKYVLKRALAALAGSARGLTLPELVAHTWPGGHFVGESGRRRAEVAISNLRRLGLRDAVVTEASPQGTRWRLDAVVVVPG